MYVPIPNLYNCNRKYFSDFLMKFYYTIIGYMRGGGVQGGKEKNGAWEVYESREK